MIERGISVNEVEEAIKSGGKEFQRPDKILHHFRYFTVVTRKIGGNHFVVTVKPRW
jgi:hypothetical protein